MTGDVLAIVSVLIWMACALVLYTWYAFGGAPTRGVRIILLVNIVAPATLLAFDVAFALGMLSLETYSFVRRHPHRVFMASGFVVAMIWHVRFARKLWRQGKQPRPPCVQPPGDGL